MSSGSAEQGSAEQSDVVVLRPDCTVRSIDHAYQALLRVTPSAGAVQVDCSGVEQADIAFVQLIVSARATYMARGVHVTIDPAPACVRNAFARSGIDLPGGGQDLSF